MVEERLLPHALSGVLGTTTQQVLVFIWDLGHIREMVAGYFPYLLPQSTGIDKFLELFLISKFKFENVLYYFLFGAGWDGGGRCRHFFAFVTKFQVIVVI